MITNFEQLGEVLAEFENRISYLENSQPIYYEEVEKEKVEPRPVVQVTYKVDGVNQMPAFGSLQKQINLLKGRLAKYFREAPDQPF